MNPSNVNIHPKFLGALLALALITALPVPPVFAEAASVSADREIESARPIELALACCCRSKPRGPQCQIL
jgi:hypothetical protein